MKEKLKSIADGMGELEKFPARYAELDAKKNELSGKIEKLAALVAGGAGKHLEALGIAREQLTQLPARAAALKAQHQSAIIGLHEELKGLYPILCQLYSAERERVAIEVGDLLKKFGCNGHTINEITRQVSNEATTVQKLDHAKMVFHSLNIAGQRIDEGVTLGRARYAIIQLADYLKPTPAPETTATSTPANQARSK